VFCKNNGVDEKIYSAHVLKDYKGRTLCPKLRLYKCPICGADGDGGKIVINLLKYVFMFSFAAHTINYCPEKTPEKLEELQKLQAKSHAKQAKKTQQLR
jgi:hypothetical protein